LPNFIKTTWKYFPNKARHCFSVAVFDLILFHGEYPNIMLGIAILLPLINCLNVFYPLYSGLVRIKPFG
jgi:hypothetical protein